MTLAHLVWYKTLRFVLIIVRRAVPLVMLGQLSKIFCIVRLTIIELILFIGEVGLWDPSDRFREAIIDTHCLDEAIHDLNLPPSIPIDFT